MIRLGSREVDAIQAASRAFLNPLEHDRVESWASEIESRIHDLLQPDSVTFMLPSEGRFRIFSQLGKIAQEYPERLKPYDARYSLWRGQVALAVWNRPLLYRGHYDAILRSRYFNEFIVPMRAFDSLGVTTEDSEGGISSLIVHHDHPTARSFGERGLEIFRLLLPSYRAGTETLARLHQARLRLPGALEEFGIPCALVDADGVEIHRTSDLDQLVISQQWREYEAVERSVARAALRGFLGQRGGAELSGPGGVYLVSAVVAPAFLWPRPCALVSVRRRQSERDDPKTVAKRYRLTPKEADVARLLVERRTNKEIATALFVSPHTARHHTEMVLRKLGVRSRRDVAEALTGASAEDTD